MTHNGAHDPDALREEIRRTRMELGETVEELAARADVKARLRNSAGHAKDRVREQAGQARDRVREQAAQTVARVRGQAAQTASAARAQAVHTAGAARAQAHETGEVVRRNPTQWTAVAAGAVATLVVLLIVRRWRR